MIPISVLLLLGAVASAPAVPRAGAMQPAGMLAPTAPATVAPVPTIPPATAAPAASPSPLASESAGSNAQTMPLGGSALATPAASGAATLAPESYGYRFVPHQPASPKPGTPQIFAVYLNAEHLKSHGPIRIRVETSTGVVKMTSKSNGRGGTIPLVAPGVFAAQGKLPAIPFIASGMSTDLIFTGTTADGQTVTVRVPVELG